MDADPPWPARLQRLPPAAAGARRAEGGLRLQREGARSSSPPPLPHQPLVSYVTVVRNCAATLPRTLASVRAQTWPNVEQVVVDGLSTDGTLQVIQDHAGQIDYFVSEPDAGLYEALNKAISLAQGALICVLNGDDWLTPDAAALAAQAHRAAGSPADHLILSGAWLIKPKGRRLWLPGDLDLGAYLSCANICHNGVYATPQAYRESGPYATDLRIAADFQWLMRCVDAGLPVTRIDAPTVCYQQGGLSSDHTLHTRNCAEVLARRFPLLGTDEVWGLLHLFHRYRGNLDAFAASRPAEPGRFLAELMQRHAGDASFQTALALAGARPVPGQPGLARVQGPSLAAKLRRAGRKLSVMCRQAGRPDPGVALR